jgi:hypothetical protein
VHVVATIGSGVVDRDPINFVGTVRVSNPGGIGRAANVECSAVGLGVLALHAFERAQFLAYQYEIKGEVVSKRDRHAIPLALKISENCRFADLTFARRLTHVVSVRTGCNTTIRLTNA